MRLVTPINRLLLSAIVVSCMFSCRNNTNSQSEKNRDFAVNTNNPREYIRYTGDSSVIISGHRGGREKGFPENSLEGFNNVLSQMPAIFEIDPRLTKDSVIVLMHDATLDRTTTGSGRVCDYTLAELKALRLKDSEGNVTEYSIPTLEEVILWSQGKTILNLDKKDVPLTMTAALIEKLDAGDRIMLTVHNGKQAKFYYDLFPGIMFSAFARTMEEYEDIDTSGVPWENMIAYVGYAITDENREIVDLLHSKGVKCMISVAPTHDKLGTSEERQKAYLGEILTHPDIIESDIPTEVWSVLNNSSAKQE